ncbi:hypothetical protein HQ563_17970 [bacterium]|nr:hypothetical protein [bacterium]
MKRSTRLGVLLSVPFALAAGAYEFAFANSYLLYEDFEDGVANGFYEVGGTWSIADGRYTQSSGLCPPRSWVNAIGNYVIQVECTPLAGLETKVIYAHADTSENYRVDLWLDRSRLSIPAWGENWSTRNFTVHGLNLAYNHSYSVKIEVGWSGVKVWVNDVLQHDRTWADGWPLGEGNIGLGTNAASSRFDDLIVSVPLVGLRTVFIEDFNDGVANGFTEVNGSWSVISGKYVQSTVSPGGPYRTWVDSLSRCLSEDLSAYVVEVDCTPHSGTATKVLYAHADGSENYRVDFWLDRSRLSIPAWGQGWSTRNVTLGGLKFSYGQTYHVTVEVSWAGVKVWVDGVLQHDEPWADDIPLGDGRVAVGTCVASSSFDNVIVRAAEGPTGRVWYVDASAGWSGDGTTWAKAFNTVQKGIDAASHGDFVLVAVGTYQEDVRFRGKNITLRGTDPLDNGVSYNTIIWGLGKQSVVTFSGTEDASCLVSGLTITNGQSPFGGGILGGTSDNRAQAYLRHVSVGSSAAENSGGGIAYFDGPILNSGIGSNWTLSTSPNGNGGGLFQCNGPIRNSWIGKNKAYTGGGLAQCNGIIEDNTIAENSASSVGGGLANCAGTIGDNNISQNSAYAGGGLADCHGLVQNNTISQNTCPELGFGGGLYRCNGTIRNNSITGNIAGQGGGVAFCDSLVEGNLIDSNRADGSGVLYSGGGLYACQAFIHNNTITRNTSNRHGGGLGHCGGMVRNNLIAENTADNEGGGLAYCSGQVRNNRIMANSAYYGGGLSRCGSRIQNNLIARNAVNDGGAGLFQCDGPLYLNTIVENQAAGTGGGLASCNGTINDCIIWGNTAVHGSPQLGGSSVPAYSCIEGWTGGGEGNTDADPKFVDQDGPDDKPQTFQDNDYRLAEGSKCIDQGKTETWMWSDLDLEGNPRVFFGGKSLTVDMGAYEYGSFPFKIVKVERTVFGEERLTWTSRNGDTYIVRSSARLPNQSWTEEKTVVSQGELTTWTDPNGIGWQKFYRIELK